MGGPAKCVGGPAKCVGGPAKFGVAQPRVTQLGIGLALPGIGIGSMHGPASYMVGSPAGYMVGAHYFLVKGKSPKIDYPTLALTLSDLGLGLNLGFWTLDLGLSTVSIPLVMIHFLETPPRP